MSKCWYCGKEIKNENNKEHIGICDECYQESFEVGNKFVSNLIEKQKQLQKEKELDNTFWKQECDSLQKALAESEEYNEMLLEEKSGYIDLISGYSKKCKSYEQQLAEKEKEIDKLEDKLHHYYEETLNNGTCGLCEHLRGEYKTDFAIEQLVSVQKYISDNAVYLEEESFGREINDYIDQQIASLREKK